MSERLNRDRVDRRTSEFIHYQGGVVSDRRKFSQNAYGVSEAKKEVLLICGLELISML